MGKKKRFVDKSQSVTFNLVDRSHGDPTGFDSNNIRIWHTANSTSHSKRREEQISCGIHFDDDYDYLQHLKDPFSSDQDTQESWKFTVPGQFDDALSMTSASESEFYGSLLRLQ